MLYLCHIVSIPPCKTGLARWATEENVKQEGSTYFIMLCSKNFAGVSTFKNNVIKLLKDNLFDDSTGIIDGYYANWGMTSGIVPVVFEKRFDKGFELKEPFSSLRSNDIIGHDVPLWFDDYNDFINTYNLTPTAQSAYGKKIVNYLKGKEFQTVFLISRDPLRTTSKKGYLQLSTPWGSHGASYKKAATCNFHFILTMLLEAGKNVYITDYSKLYAKDTTSNSKSPSIQPILNDPLKNAVMREILAEEWKLINKGNQNAIAVQLGKDKILQKQIVDALRINASKLKQLTHPAAALSYANRAKELQNL